MKSKMLVIVDVFMYVFIVFINYHYHQPSVFVIVLSHVYCSHYCHLSSSSEPQCEEELNIIMMLLLVRYDYCHAVRLFV